MGAHSRAEKEMLTMLAAVSNNSLFSIVSLLFCTGARAAPNNTCWIIPMNFGGGTKVASLKSGKTLQSHFNGPVHCHRSAMPSTKQ